MWHMLDMNENIIVTRNFPAQKIVKETNVNYGS